MKKESYTKFRAFHDSLVLTAVSKGVAYDDAQDLAGDAVEKALPGFDPAKGEFSAYCHTILANLIRNHWRDRKKTEEFAEEGHVDPDSTIDLLELAQTIRGVRAVLDDIAKDLSPEAHTFLKHLQEVLDECGPRAVSEAARRSGLTPAKGWDLFRKIQRKARAIPLSSDLREGAAPSVDRAPAPLRSISLTADATPVMYHRRTTDPLSRFTESQLTMIESLLP